MGPVPINRTTCDFRYVSKWTRMFSSPKCIHCNRRMKFKEYPYDLMWECEYCDCVTFFTPKKKIYDFRSKTTKE